MKSTQPRCSTVTLMSHANWKGEDREGLNPPSAVWGQTCPSGISLVIQWLRLHLPVPGVWVWSLVGELRSHMPRDRKNWKHKTETTVVTNSVKTEKVVHIKKKNLKKNSIVWKDVKNKKCLSPVLVQQQQLQTFCLVAKSCSTLWPHGLKPTRLLCPWDFPGKNTGVGCHFLL